MKNGMLLILLIFLALSVLLILSGCKRYDKTDKAEMDLLCSESFSETNLSFTYYDLSIGKIEKDYSNTNIVFSKEYAGFIICKPETIPDTIRNCKKGKINRTFICVDFHS